MTDEQFQKIGKAFSQILEMIEELDRKIDSLSYDTESTKSEVEEIDRKINILI